jgi:hypothetical protein
MSPNMRREFSEGVHHPHLTPRFALQPRCFSNFPLPKATFQTLENDTRRNVGCHLSHLTGFQSTGNPVQSNYARLVCKICENFLKQVTRVLQKLQGLWFWSFGQNKNRRNLEFIRLRVQWPAVCMTDHRLKFEGSLFNKIIVVERYKW